MSNHDAPKPSAQFLEDQRLSTQSLLKAAGALPAAQQAQVIQAVTNNSLSDPKDIQQVIAAAASQVPKPIEANPFAGLLKGVELSKDLLALNAPTAPTTGGKTVPGQQRASADNGPRQA